MKKLKILISSLTTISALPVISLVSCGYTEIKIDQFNSDPNDGLSSEKIDDLSDGQKVKFTIEMTEWKKHSPDPEHFLYLLFFISSNGHNPDFIRKFKFKENSIKISFDGEELPEDKWEYTGNGDVMFRDPETIVQIFNANYITGSFIAQSLLVPGLSSAVTIDLCGKLNTPK